MSEIMKQGSENSLSVGEDLIKALVSKTIDNGASILKNSELIGKVVEMVEKMPDPRSVGEGLGQRLDKWEAGLRNLGFTAEGIKALVQAMAGQPVIRPEDLEDLRQALKQHTQLFEKPLKKTIHHTHFLGRPVWIMVGMGALILGLVIFNYHVWAKAVLHEENDIKWRYIKQTHDRTVLKALTDAEDAYKAFPEQFKKDVKGEEDRRQRLLEVIMQDSASKDEIQDLKNQEKKR